MQIRGRERGAGDLPGFKPYGLRLVVVGVGPVRGAVERVEKCEKIVGGDAAKPFNHAAPRLIEFAAFFRL